MVCGGEAKENYIITSTQIIFMCDLRPSINKKTGVEIQLCFKDIFFSHIKNSSESIQLESLFV